MNQEQLLNRNAKSILRTAQRLDVPIMMLVQENNAGEVRDCAAAAMHAQNRLSISWKETERRAGPPGIAPRPHGHPAKIAIRKCRNGKSGISCHTYFYPQFTLFSDEEP